MTVGVLAGELGLKAFSEPDIAREVGGGYTSDLLSWVMARAKSGDAWVTIMSNVNVVAVATLADVSMVILAEGVQPDEGMAQTARDRGVNLYGSELSSYELCARISKRI